MFLPVGAPPSLVIFKLNESHWQTVKSSKRTSTCRAPGSKARARLDPTSTARGTRRERLLLLSQVAMDIPQGGSDSAGLWRYVFGPFTNLTVPPLKSVGPAVRQVTRESPRRDNYVRHTRNRARLVSFSQKREENRSPN